MTNKIPTYTFKFDGTVYFFHSLSGVRYYSRRVWWKPWRKLWFVEMSLFNIFNFPSALCDGSYKFISHGLKTEGEAKVASDSTRDTILELMRRQK
jgi:hypothetical protein